MSMVDEKHDAKHVEAVPFVSMVDEMHDAKHVEAAFCEHSRRKAQCKDCKPNIADVLANEGWNFNNV